MPHTWRIVKNSTTGGHRPVSEFVEELEVALSEFEQVENRTTEHSSQQFLLDDTVREFLGLGKSELVMDAEAKFSNPYPFMHGHGSYVCGLLSTPTNVDDGHAEFTSLFLVASTRQLLTVILDPPTTYAGPFGQRLLNRNADHQMSDSNDVGTTVLMIIRDNVTSINFALREISLDTEHIQRVLETFGSDRHRHTFDALKRIEAQLVRMKIEVDSLETVVEATSELLRQISNNEVDVDGESEIFDRRHEIAAAMLTLQAKQTVSVRERLDEKLSALASKCEALRDKFFVEATHRIGAVASLLLVPTFIVGLYGQNFEIPEQRWANGYVFSWGLILTTSIVMIVYFKRKRWL